MKCADEVREYALQKLELVRDRIVSHKPQDSAEHELVRRAVTDGQKCLYFERLQEEGARDTPAGIQDRCAEAR
jgi:hypothetical protein